MLKQSHNTWLPVFAVVLLASGCQDECSSFSGTSTCEGGGSGGSGGSGAPTLLHTPVFGSALYAIKISGDASHLVFVSNQNILGQNEGNAQQIFGVNIIVGNLVQITTEPVTNFFLLQNFEITDSGDLVLFASFEDLTGDNPTLDQNLFLANTESTVVTQVTRNNLGGLYNEWEISGDGSLIVFTSEMDLLGTNGNNNNQLFTINSDSTGLTQITADNSFPVNVALARDGSRVAYTESGDPVGNNTDLSREVFVINVDGSDRRQLTDMVGIVNIARLKISDDGEKIVFATHVDLVGNNADGEYEVFVANGDGSGLIQITNSDRPSGTYLNGTPGDYDVSGNGSYVIFGSDFDFTGENPANDHTIFWATIDGSTVGQPLREGTVIPSAVSYQAYDMHLSNAGDTILFETTVNMTVDSSGGWEKIYTIARQ